MNYSFLGAVDPGNPSTWSVSLIVVACMLATVGAILFIVTMIWFITWIKYSWFHRENSANLSGGDLAKTYIQKYGINAPRIKFKGFGNVNGVTVEPRFFYLRPYLINNGHFTLRLLPWTYHRRSIYSLAMAMESSWAVSSSKSSRFNTFWWDFSRKLTLFFILIPIVLALLFAISPINSWITLSASDANTLSIVLSILGSIFLIVYASMQLVFYAKSRKEICTNLVGILNEKEIRAIGWIFQIKFIYYLIRTIYEVLQLIFRIMMYIQSEKK
ncbi:hypothetical protein [Spiroplasma sp. AdecLV25b]|uniref:hypothetical protein n=1 Tax=Spiroplasma sp. AdecLV25b TaxID=3027162 RepID=UPI0027E00CAC|nr:hypothetical protein [Spiroplasma sp. AdecLV25b]